MNSTEDWLETSIGKTFQKEELHECNEASKNSHESLSPNTDKKSKTKKFWSLKKKIPTPDAKTSKKKDLSSHSPKIKKKNDILLPTGSINNLATDFPSNDDGKRKRRAPLPPSITAAKTENIIPEDPDIEVPSPPPYSLKPSDAQSQQLPWLVDKSSHTAEYSDEIEYSTSYETLMAYAPLEALKKETPICTSVNCSIKTSNDLSLLNSESSSIQIPGPKPLYNDDYESDPDDHVYSVIRKTSPADYDSVNLIKPIIEDTVKSDGKTNVLVDFEPEISSTMPVSKMENITNFQFSTEQSSKDVCDGNIIKADMDTSDVSIDSDNSSIDTPIYPNTRKKKIKDIDQSKKRETLTFVLKSDLSKATPNILHIKSQGTKQHTKPLLSKTDPSLETPNKEVEIKPPKDTVDSIDTPQENYNHKKDIVIAPKPMTRTNKPAVLTSPKPMMSNSINPDSRNLRSKPPPFPKNKVILSEVTQNKSKGTAPDKRPPEIFIPNPNLQEANPDAKPSLTDKSLDIDQNSDFQDPFNRFDTKPNHEVTFPDSQKNGQQYRLNEAANDKDKHVAPSHTGGKDKFGPKYPSSQSNTMYFYAK